MNKKNKKYIANVTSTTIDVLGYIASKVKNNEEGLDVVIEIFAATVASINIGGGNIGEIFKQMLSRYESNIHDLSDHQVINPEKKRGNKNVKKCTRKCK